MKNIRRNVFETNSSSVHSITIGDNLPNDFEVPKRLEVCDLEVGRDFCYNTVQERYTIAVLMAYSEGRETFEKLIRMLDKIGVKEKILAKCTGADVFWSGVGIELGNAGEASEGADYYMDEILESEDSLKRWLFALDSELSGEDDNNFDY